MLKIGDRVRNEFGVVYEVVDYSHTFKEYKLKHISKTGCNGNTSWEEKWIVDKWTRIY